MRFGLVHRVMTDALAALGVLAVVSTATLGHLTNWLLIVGLVCALAIPERWQGRPALGHFATLGPFALLIIQGCRLATGHSPLDVAVEFAAILQILRLATRRGAAHDQQIIVLALLHFVAGTVLGGGLTYALCFLGFLVVAPGALVLSHLRREVEGNYRQGARDRTGLPVDVPRILRSRRVVGRGFLGATCLLSVPILLFTAALFIVFPRIGLSLLLLSHPRAGRMIGFSDHVDLGDVGVLRDDPTIALRFEVHDMPGPPPPRLTLRMRGTAFDAYDGHAWARTLREPPHSADRAFIGSGPFAILRHPDTRRDPTMSVDLEPIDPPVVFLPPRAVALRVLAPAALLMGDAVTIQRTGEDELRYAGSDSRGLRYEVYLAREDEALGQPLPAVERALYLAVAPDLSARLAVLARTWVEGLSTADEKATAIERHLRREFIYDLHSPSAGKPRPVDDFLFESRRGHCEFFSTAMTLMLRAVGVPSRNVTGFVGGTWNRFGHYYAVRQGDAHSWVEAYLDDGPRPGWRTFDPTPASGARPLEPQTGAYYYLRDLAEALSQRWNTYVVGYDIHKQVRLFDDVSRNYERLRAKAGMNRGILDYLTRGPALATLALAAGAAAYAVWRRRPKGRAQAAALDGPRRGDPRTAPIVHLFRALESSMLALGVARSAAVPPLRHAEQLVSRRHPMGEEVLALTKVYLETRFGGAVLTEGSRRDFERRLHELRATPRRWAEAAGDSHLS